MEPRSYTSPARAEAAERTRERIMEAAMPLFLEAPYEDVTLRRIAAAAGVSLQTVVNHYGTKEGLFAEGTRRHAAQAADSRAASVPDDVTAAVTFLGEDYEAYGDANWRLLVVADRIPVVADALQLGRDLHRDWVQATFPGAYAGLTGKARDRRIRLLMAASDALTWKLLRRDHGLSQKDTVAAMRDGIQALYCLNGAGPGARS